MANKNAANGFTPIDILPGRVHRYLALTGPLAVGDPVVRTTSTDVNGYPAVIRATTGNAITGIVVQVEPNIENLNEFNYVASGDARYVMVADHPQQEFIVQEGGSGTNLSMASIGKHIDALAADANALTGRSAYQIDNNAVANANTFRIERLLDVEGNELGPYAKWVVKANLHTEVNASATTLTEV